MSGTARLLIVAVLICGASGRICGRVWADDICPIFGGKVTKVGNVTDDKAKPSKNITVWNRSSCGGLVGYGPDSAICTQCWHAHSTLKVFDYWERSSVEPDSFLPPLAADIRQFPLPAAKQIKSGIVYSQKCVGTQVTESVAFWCTDSSDVLSAFRDYAQKHDLTVRTAQQGRIKNQLYVTVEAKPRKALAK
jgi:hypothetical protein